MDQSKYEKIFIQEAEKYLGDLNELLMRVEKNPSSKELWVEIHGKVHSMKGMARALSLEKISQLSHSMESWCKIFQTGQLEPSAEEIQKIVEGTDMLKTLSLKLCRDLSPQDQQFYESISNAFTMEPQGAKKPYPTQDHLNKHSPLSVDKLDHVKVDYALIEELLGISQEIILLDRTMPPLSKDQISSSLKNWIYTYVSMLKQLHFRLAQLRLVSIGDFSDLFKRTIRDLARENKKEVNFEVEGDKLQADITLLNRLREPFMHIIRNAVAHGIESPDERERLGKDRPGKIRLKADRERDNLYISISDDGRGIDRDAIVNFLKEKKGLNEKEIELMSDENLFQTIISPEYSSAKQTSHIAGRGVGMSLVNQVIEYLGGKMTIHSKPSDGTELVIRLPVSLFLMNCITFNIGDYVISIPTGMVLSAGRDSPNRNGQYDLRKLMGIREDPKIWGHTLEVACPKERRNASTGDRLLSFSVDNIVGNKRIMVMPAGEILSKTGLIAGIGIMDDGRISILLDIESLPENPSLYYNNNFV